MIMVSKIVRVMMMVSILIMPIRLIRAQVLTADAGSVLMVAAKMTMMPLMMGHLNGLIRSPSWLICVIVGRVGVGWIATSDNFSHPRDQRIFYVRGILHFAHLPTSCLETKIGSTR